jgi:HEAT repeat protein
MSLMRKVLGVVGLGPDALLAALKKPDIEARKAAAAKLGRLGNPEFVKPLLLALDADSRLSDAVVDAVVRIGTPAIALLIAILRERNVRHQWYEDTSAALGRIGEPALAPLIAVLEDPSAGGREYAIPVVAELGGTRSAEVIAAFLEDRNCRIRRAAADALTRLDWQPETTDTRVLFYLATENGAALAALGGEAVEPLIRRLKGGCDDRIIAEALGSIGDARAVEPLHRALRDGPNDSQIDGTIIEALLKIGGAGVDAVLAKMDTHPCDTFHLYADVAPQLGPRGVESLKRALLSYPYVRRCAAAALSKMAWIPETTEWAAAYLMASEKLDACADLGAPAVPALIEALTGGEPYGFDLKRPAAKALLRIGKPAVEALIAALHKYSGTSDSFPTLAGLLGKIGDPQAIEPLVYYMKNNSVFTYRQAAVTALRSWDWSPSAPADKLPYLVATLEWNRCEELGESIVPTLISALSTTHAPEDRILKALVKIGAPAMDPLSAAIREPWAHEALTAKIRAALEVIRSGQTVSAD